MKIVITGATGNVGTSTIRALRQAGEVEEIVGVARRLPGDGLDPADGLDGVSWVDADVVTSELEPILAGADAVIHLAWAIQPSRDQELVELVNVEGSRRVFEAAAAAGVGKIVYASSVGAYSPGPKDREVDEDWPVDGIESSFYSRHKAAVERILDEFERRHRDFAVARLRPALIFKDEAATEIRRLFVGPFLPNFLVDSRFVPLLPRIAGLRFQAVHSLDVGEAFATAALREVSGAFNLAAPPVLDSKRLAELLGARTFPVAPRLARGLADLSWHLRVQPSPPGWLDLALGAPLMSSERARRELGWRPRHSAEEALAELLEGIREGSHGPTPPLREAGLGGRAEEVRGGVGARDEGVRERDEQLVKYLTDVHAIELQALVQMKAAPALAGDAGFAEIFERHQGETEAQEQRVRDRLEAHGAGPSAIKDLTAKGTGAGMVAFAGLQPQTPGKLAAHAFSYEHMEIAAYELLGRLAEQAGDRDTAAVAAANVAEERRMAERVAANFDAALEASLDSGDEEELRDQMLAHLADAHAIESQAEQLLSSAVESSEDALLSGVYREHLLETGDHQRWLEERLAELDGSPSLLKDAALRAGALNLGSFFGVQPDTTAKLAGFAYAFEHLEAGAYELLGRLAARAGDAETALLVERILAQERAAAERIAEASWDRAEDLVAAA